MTSNLLSMAGAAMLLSMDFHVTVVSAMVEIYTEIPVGALERVNQEMLISSVFDATSFAFLLAWPFVAVNLLYNLCLGFINKALPQLMVAFVGAPFMIGAGLILLTISLVTMLTVWMERVPGLVGWL